MVSLAISHRQDDSNSNLLGISRFHLCLATLCFYSNLHSLPFSCSHFSLWLIRSFLCAILGPFRTSSSSYKSFAELTRKWPVGFTFLFCHLVYFCSHVFSLSVFCISRHVSHLVFVPPDNSAYTFTSKCFISLWLRLSYLSLFPFLPVVPNMSFISTWKLLAKGSEA